MKLFLHIGTEKTGSTSFQNWSWLNQKVLSENGIFYSRVLGHENHIKVYLWSLDHGSDDDGFLRAGLVSRREQQVFRSTLPAQFAQEVKFARDMGCHSFLISNEHCHSRLRSIEDLERLYSFLCPHFDEIEVLCSLRPQIDVAVSLTSTAARVGLKVTRDFFEQVTPLDLYYDYFDLLNRWADVFGHDNITVIPFRREPDMAAYFINRLNLPSTALFKSKRINEALAVRAIALSNAVSDGQFVGPREQPMSDMSMMLDLMRPGERLRPGIELARKVQYRFNDINKKVVRQWVSISDADLEPDWSGYELAGNLDVLDQPCSFTVQLAELLSLYEQRVFLARAGEMAASAERALANNNLDAVKDFLRYAYGHLLEIPETSRLYDDRREIELRLEPLGNLS